MPVVTATQQAEAGGLLQVIKDNQSKMVRLFFKTKELIYIKFLEPFPGFMYSIQLLSTPPFLLLFLSSLSFYR